MKKLLSLLLIIASTFSATTAQTTYKKKTLEERSAKFTKEITDYISNVTPEQNTALLEINKNVTMQFDSLKALQLESDEYKPAARNVFKTRDAAIKLVFDAKQFDEFLMLQAEKRDAAYKKKNEANKAALTEETAKAPAKTYRKKFVKEADTPILDSLKH